MLESNRVKLKLNEDVYKKNKQKKTKNKTKHVSKVFINLLDNSLQSS